MSCSRMESKILGYVDGRLKESERLEMEKHVSTCAACRVRVNEFRTVNVLLDELPMIEPSAAFDIRLHARVAAEPAGMVHAGAKGGICGGDAGSGDGMGRVAHAERSIECRRHRQDQPESAGAGKL